MITLKLINYLWNKLIKIERTPSVSSRFDRCAYYRDENSLNYIPNGSGTCRHPDWKGLPCKWPIARVAECYKYTKGFKI